MNGLAFEGAWTLLALAAVLVLAWGVLWLLRGRLGGGGGRRQDDAEALRFVRALPLGPRERVVLVEHRGERWLLGVTAGGISVLDHRPVDGTAADPSWERPQLGTAAGPAYSAAPTPAER